MLYSFNTLLSWFSSFLHIPQDLENVGQFSWQFEHLVSLGQPFSAWFESLWLHLPRIWMLSAGFPVMSIFFTFKAPQGCADVLFYSFEGIFIFHFLEYCWFVKSQNVGVCPSNGHPFIICDLFLSWGCFYLHWCN